MKVHVSRGEGRKKSCWCRLLSQVSTHFHFITIYISSLSAVFFVEVILLRRGRTIKDSFEATWPLSLTLKAQHLLVLDVKLNPLMISSLQRSHGKFLLDYIVGKKALNLTLNLNRLFFPAFRPLKFDCFYHFITFIKKHREFLKVKLQFRSLTWIPN